MMLIRNKTSSDIPESEITSEKLFIDRRRFLVSAIGAALPTALGSRAAEAGVPINNIKKSAYSVDEKPTDIEFITSYNNFYEFGTGKEDPKKEARKFNPKPWTISVEGEVKRPARYDLYDLISRQALEERIYRFRCVEAWSMVVPWVGVPLADVIKRLEPTSRAKYVSFETLFDPQRMPGQKRQVLPWPYREGLRIDEATNPLALLVVGLYGEELPNQSGAPVRLIVPWKYGFKSIKSIVRINFSETMPETTWNMQAPGEYGFYANVNPNVDHPRWSQAKERRLGGGLFSSKRETLMFNGYGEQVAGLYAGMDLSRYY